MSSKRTRKPVAKKQSLQERGVLLAGVVISGALLLFFGYRLLQSSANRSVTIEGVQQYELTAGQHTESRVTYDVIPPVGGPHHPSWQKCAVYTEPLINEHAVHALEHGAVWITYSPGLPEDQVEKLQAITRGGAYRMLSPYPGIDSPIIASAWGYQLKLKNADDPALMQFVLKYENSPDGPEYGATCSNGVTRTAG